MDMAIDEARHDDMPGEIEDIRRGGSAHGFTHLGDLAVFGQDLHPAERPIGLAIPQSTADKYNRRLLP